MKRTGLVPTVIVSLAMAGFLTLPNAEAMDMRQTTWLEQPAFLIENSFYRLTISPGHGGRIVSWIDKEPRRADGEFVYFTPQDGGLLDDRGPLTTAKYDGEVVRQTPGEIAVRLSIKEGSGVVREKVITCYEQNRVLKVEYRLTNRGPNALEPSDVMFKNHIRYSKGQKESPRLDGYSFFTPLTTGVRESLFPAMEHGVGLNSYDYANVAAPWLAQLDKDSLDGIAVAFEPGVVGLSAYYWMKRSTPWNTFEWGLKTPRLPVGGVWETRFLFIMQRGLPGYTDVTDRYIAWLSPQVEGRKVAIALSLTPVTDILDLNDKPLVRTEIRDLKAKTIAQLPELQFPRLWIRESATTKTIETKSVAWDADRDGTLVVWQQVLIGGKIAGEYELPFVVGKPSGEYVRGGARLQPKVVAYQLDEADAKRGYIAVWRTREGPVQDVQVVKCNVGTNELEQVHLEVIAFRDIGKVKVAASPVSGPAVLASPRIRIRQVEAGDTEMKKYGLFDKTEFAAVPGQTTDVWLTFDFRGGVKPGDYAAELTLTPENAPPKVTPFEIKVWPVRIADRRLSKMYAYWEVSIIRTETGAKDAAETARIFEPYARDLAEAGEPCLHLLGEREGVVKKKGADGKDVYDFSALDPVIAVARKQGMTDAWLTWTCPGLPEYLHAHGMGDVFIPALDECPLRLPQSTMDALKAWAETDPPYVRRHAALSPVSVELVNSVRDYIKLWTFGGSLVYAAMQWQREGKIHIPPEQGFGFYGGGAYGYVVPYSQAIKNGWYAGWLDCTHWVDYCYLRDRPPGKPWRSVFITREGPVSSTGWEGFKDGNECFEYLKMVHAAARDLETKGNAKAAETVRRRLALIIGSADSCPVKTKAVVWDGMATMELAGDLADFLKAKAMVLELLTDALVMK